MENDSTWRTGHIDKGIRRINHVVLIVAISKLYTADHATALASSVSSGRIVIFRRRGGRRGRWRRFVSILRTGMSSSIKTFELSLRGSHVGDIQRLFRYKEAMVLLILQFCKNVKATVAGRVCLNLPTKTKGTQRCTVSVGPTVAYSRHVTIK